MKNIFSKRMLILALLAVILGGFLFFNQASAAGLVPCGDGSDPSQRCTLCHLVVGFQNLINYGFRILVVLALLMLVVAGVIYIFSSGDQGMIGTAKGMMKNTLFGFAFVLLAWLLVNYTIILLGANIGVAKTGATWNSFTCDQTRTPMPTSAPVGGGGDFRGGGTTGGF